MTRRLRAVLIAVPESDLAPGDRAPDAIPTVHLMHEFLSQRFVRPQIEVLTTEHGPVTGARVLKALGCAASEPSDLFVVLFFGHGVPAAPNRPFQSWALSGTDELRDLDLVEVLAGLSPDIDVVVLSVCCYGLGFFVPGEDVLAAHPVDRTLDRLVLPPEPWGFEPAYLETIIHGLKLFSTQFVTRVQQAKALRHVPLICAAAAGVTDTSGGLVFQALAKELVGDVIVAAQRRETYGALKAQFHRNQAAGRTFHLAARPDERMFSPVLGT